MGNMGCFPQGRPLGQSHATHSVVHVGCFSVSSEMDYRFFNVCTDFDACLCTRGCIDTVRESAVIVDWKKNPLLHLGIEPASLACWSD